MATKSVCDGYDCKDESDDKSEAASISTIYQTNAITLSKYIASTSESAYRVASSVPSYDAEQSSQSTEMYARPVYTPAADQFAHPSSGHGYPASNSIISYGTTMALKKPSARKTKYSSPEFTGAASGLKSGDLVTVVGIFAAFAL
jgi:hypothetical protein